MASYNELIALINAFIKQNGIQAITGQILNGVLRAMVDQIGRGYAIMGTAVPTDDPGTPDAPESWFASTPGTYTNFGGFEVADAEFALLSYTPSTGWAKNTLTTGITEVDATVDNTTGTPSVSASYANGVLSFEFHNLKGATGDPAGFGTVNATVDANVGTPSVSVSGSGPDTAKNYTFAFHNLKGETGVTSVVATVDNTTGNPACAVSLVGQELHLDFTGLKGAQGNTGSSVDYPFTIVNNLTTNDATQALSAAMGVELAGQVSQLEAEVSGLEGVVLSPKLAKFVDFGGNFFDKNAVGIIANAYVKITDGTTTANSYYSVSDYIPIRSSVNYTLLTYPSLYGADNAKEIVCYDKNKNFIGTSTGTVSDTNKVTFQLLPGALYVRVTFKNTDIDTFMLVEGDTYPSDYVKYNWKPNSLFDYSAIKTDIENDLIPEINEAKAAIDRFTYERGVNLFDKNSLLIKNGYYTSSGGYTDNASYFVTGPIAVTAGITYKAPYDSSLGLANDVIAIVNAENSKTGTIYGNIADGYITFIPASDCLVSLNGGKTNKLDTFMVCVSADYPNNYIAYYPPYWKLKDESSPCILTGKSVIFTGDSICYGAHDTPSGGGWAKRIGEKNHMVWKNKAVSGGTIIDKDLIDSSFTICDTDFENGADYIILEGGTNDADRIGSILGDSLPALYGSYDEADYVTTFANSTFCSAVQRLIQRVVTTFPTAKVGFIIAPKMGVTSAGYTKDVSNRRAYFETVMKICKKWGVPVLNLWDECTMNPRLSAHYDSESHGPLYYDGQHPTALGYDFMSPMIEEWMKTL